MFAPKFITGVVLAVAVADDATSCLQVDSLVLAESLLIILTWEKSISEGILKKSLHREWFDF